MPCDSPYAYAAQHMQHEHTHRYHPSGFIPSPSSHCGLASQRPANEHEHENESSSWACDYCQVATFGTFQEASDHERSCSMNQNMLAATTTATTINTGTPIQSFPSTSKPQLLLRMPSDKQSLSDRQCYVRSHFVEIFEADDGDVSARHSKGAQKLRIGQIGIRCMHCVDLQGKQRAERATCYPSSVSRIYQTVADMQRFHFEACTAIPESMKAVYRGLKTTRPRGQGSPQSYWISSAKEMGLVDTSQGIRLSEDSTKRNFDNHSPSSPYATSSMSSYGSGGVSSPAPSSPFSQRRITSLPPLSPESHSSSRTAESSLPQEQSDMSMSMSDGDPRDEDANMLLALRSASLSHESSP